ncbi:hypothetical protein [Paenibacillus dendritiformis]|uniref:hypothetical protein n=1 Tax=Paenibacillus dendritiformis TaxID=130049 RepID=UPI00387E1034
MIGNEISNTLLKVAQVIKDKEAGQMVELSSESMIDCFNHAKELGVKFIGVKIQMDGFPKDEVIINECENIDDKVAYYKKTYDNDLNHRFAQGIKITGFGFGDTFMDIQHQLLKN